MRTVPVTAPDAVAESDLDGRVSGLVNEASRIVAEKFEAKQKAAEEAARAAKAALLKAAADPAAGGVKQDGGCSGKHYGK
jgi:sRNA-binding protein